MAHRVAYGSDDYAAAAAAERTAAVGGRRARGVEDDILRVESKLPGFGGFYVDSSGIVVVHGPPNMSVEAVQQSMVMYASEFKILNEHQRQLVAGNRIRVLPAQYPFSRLLVWARGLGSLDSPGDGITSYGVDHRRNRVRVGVADTMAIAKVYARADSARIPRDAIVTHRSGKSVAEGIGE